MILIVKKIENHLFCLSIILAKTPKLNIYKVRAPKILLNIPGENIIAVLYILNT